MPARRPWPDESGPDAFDDDDEAQELRPFAPTAGMCRYARACCDPKLPPKDEDCCRAAHVSPLLLARWRRDRRFESWLNAEIRRLMSLHTHEIWAIVIRRARKGNLQAAKMYLERFDRPIRTASLAPQTFKDLAELALQTPDPLDDADDAQPDYQTSSTERKSQPHAALQDEPKRDPVTAL